MVNLTDSEINELYNHPKVKGYGVSLTKGEGFGRPLLRIFTTTGKPSYGFWMVWTYRCF